VYAIHRILVAIKDPRARAIPAIAKAAQLARALGAEVCLFHAIPEPIYLDIARLDGPSLAQLEQRQSQAYQRRLEALAQGLRRRGLEVTPQSHGTILRTRR
jgi:nucleotide-binding universal stress UspA family protein